MRCAHILKLIVHDVLKELDQSIARIRVVVKYVKSSIQKWSLFKLCCENEKITYKSQVCLDVAIRYNSTSMILDRIETFWKAFQQLEEEDLGYNKTVRVIVRMLMTVVMGVVKE